MSKELREGLAKEMARADACDGRDHWPELAPDVCGWYLRIAGAALTYIRQHDDWQPIETAPKDGTHVQLYRPEIQVTGYYAIRIAAWCVVAPGLPTMNEPPTHWQPLPAPPKEQNNG